MGKCHEQLFSCLCGDKKDIRVVHSVLISSSWKHSTVTVKAQVHGIHDTSARVTGITVFKNSMHLSSQNKSRERYMISVNLWPVGKLLYIEIPGECYLLTMRLTNKHWGFVEGSWRGAGAEVVDTQMTRRVSAF